MTENSSKLVWGQWRSQAKNIIVGQMNYYEEVIPRPTISGT